jgi:hypothetical protein
MLVNPCWKTHAKWKTPLSMPFLTKLPKISSATSHSRKENKHTKLLLAAAALHHLISLNNKYLLQLEQACWNRNSMAWDCIRVMKKPLLWSNRKDPPGIASLGFCSKMAIASLHHNRSKTHLSKLYINQV